MRRILLSVSVAIAITHCDYGEFTRDSKLVDSTQQSLVTPIANAPIMTKDGVPFFLIGAYDFPDRDIDLIEAGLIFDGGPNGSLAVNSTNNGNREMDAGALSELSQAGFNLVRTRLYNLDTIRLEMAHRYGIFLAPYSFEYQQTGPFDGSQTDWNHFTELQQDGGPLNQKIAELVAAPYRSNILLYENADEAAWNSGVNGRQDVASFGQALNYKNVVKRWDPQALFWYNEAASPAVSVALAQSWSTLSDAHSQDSYPVYGNPATFPNADLSSIGATVDTMVGATYGPIFTGPVFMVLEAQGANECCWNWNGAGAGGIGRRPNLTEIRFEAYSSIVHGAKGILWWGIDAIGRNSQIWSDVRQVAGELRDIEKPLATDAQSGLSLGFCPKSGGFANGAEGSYRIVDGYRYLIVANGTKFNQ